MYRIKQILLAALLLLSIHCFAQSDSLPLKISLEKNTTGDSLWLTVTLNTYTRPSSLMFAASLENSIEKDTFFLPVIDSGSSFCFIFPAELHKNLLLQAYFSPGIFKISGFVNDHKTQPSVKAILITDNQQLFNREIVLQDDGHFTLPSLVFENNASLAFNYINQDKKKDHPDISLITTPALTDFKQLIFSSSIKRSDIQNTEAASKPNVVNDSLEKRTNTENKYKTLDKIKVTGIKKSNIEKFDEEYSTGLFHDGNERIIDCIDNNNIQSFPDCISFLQSRVPGLSISTERMGEMAVKWRGHQMKAFYIDEMAVDIDQLVGMNTADIAMLKVYPPPFFGSVHGDGGAIAVYTRRGEYRIAKADDKKWLFTIKGYSPPVHVLFTKNKD